MGRVSKHLNNLRSVSKVYYAFIILSAVFLAFIVFSFKANFLNYQQEQVTLLKDGISSALKSDDISQEIVDLNKDYSFEIIVQEDSTILYTSNTLYDIDNANVVYNDNFVYKEAYQDGDYLVWLVVTNVDVVPFVNSYLIYALVVVLLIIVVTTFFLRTLYINSSKPIIRTIEIIENIKAKSSLDGYYDKDLDIVNEELLVLYSNLSFQKYQLSQTSEEYERISKIQKSLLEEQKSYLETVIHDIKSPIASINYSRFIIDSVIKDKDANIQESLDNIKEQSEETLAIVVETLETVRANTFEKFVEKDKININELVEKYLEKNRIVIEKSGFKPDVNNEIEWIFTNRLKFIQMTNNILSNMLNYSKENSTLYVNVTKTGITFTNEKGKDANEFSTKYGNRRITELASELGMELKVVEDEETYTINVIFGDGHV